MGSAGLGYVEYATIIEDTLARGRLGGNLCCGRIRRFVQITSTNSHWEQKQKFLIPLATRSAPRRMGLTEPSAGRMLRERARCSAPGWWLGCQRRRRHFITHAISRPTLASLFASTDRTKGNRGITAFIFQKRYKRVFRRQRRKTSSGCARLKPPASYLKTVTCRMKAARRRRHGFYQCRCRYWMAATHFYSRSGCRHGAGRVRIRIALRERTGTIR